MLRIILSLIFVLAATATIAANAKPAGDLKSFGNADAPQGGTFNYNLQGEPTTLHPITSTDLYAQIVHSLTIATLMKRNPETFDWMPALAESSKISADGKTYTFVLRKDAKFHDGHPVTAEDVKFSFDAIFDDQYHAAHLRPYYEGFEKAEVIDPLTVKFTTKEKYYGNFDQIVDMNIIPKHIYETDAGKKLNKSLIGAGPYKIEKYDQGQSIMLVRDHAWWGNQLPQFKGRYNFEHIRMRFIQDENVALEMLKKGELDFDGFQPETYVKKAVGAEWGKTVFKVKAENSMPKGYLYVGWNFRKPMFQDKRVRLALANLVNRAEMNEKFNYGLTLLATGPWYQQSEFADHSVKPIPYDPKKALELLKSAGWTDSDKNGILDKTVDGKKTEFRFTVTYGWKDGEKYLLMMQQDLKRVGIDMQLQLLEWNAMMKLIDKGDFDASFMAWGADPNNDEEDPKQIWYSTSAVPGGSNHIAYNNPEVDKLIDASRAELDKKKRIVIKRKIYKLIADDAPYVFMFNNRYALYGMNAHVKSPKPTQKFEIGWTYWWAADAK